jgi:hypothetical protein
MPWIDQLSYFGPDRRDSPRRLRLLERRRENLAGPRPRLQRALRQLRLKVIDAHGAAGVAKFLDRVRAVAQLAEAEGASDVSAILQQLMLRLSHPSEADMRPYIYEQLDRLYDTRTPA